MAKKHKDFRTGARLGDAKGGDLLAEIARAFKQDTSPASASAKPTATPNNMRHNSHRSKKPKPARLPPQGEKAVAAVKAKGRNVQRVKLPKEVVQAIYAQTRPSENDAPVLPQNTYDFGKSSFDKIARFKPELANFLADHRAPDVADGDLAALVAHRIDRCVAGLHQIIDPDADGYLGYDFGTSSTKAVVRWPYRASSPAYAIPVPPKWQSGGQPHVWPTVVFFDPENREFSLLPGAGRIRLAGFKSALIEGEGYRMCGNGVTMQVAATAFLTLHLAYVIGTIGEHGEAGLSTVNVAIPVAALGDKGRGPAGRVASDFEGAMRAALHLLPSANSLTKESIEKALTLTGDPPLDFELHPELSGVIAGYCRGPRHHIGSHMIIDCGSATLDMATFSLNQSDWPLAIHAASVELLGSDACIAYCRAGAKTGDCSGAARYQDHLVCSQSLKYKGSGFGQTMRQKYSFQVILAGGGIDKPWIADMLRKWEARFEKPFQRPALDPGLRCEEGYEATRLVLADGLARASVDLRKVQLPSASTAPAKFNPNHHDWTTN